MAERAKLYVGTEKGLLVYERHRRDLWRETRRHFSAPVDAFAGCIERPEIVYAGVIGDGAYRTTDGGDHWERVFKGDARALVVDPADDRVVYLGTEPVALYRSHDRGDHWSELNSLLDMPDEIKENWRSNHPPFYGHVRYIYIEPETPGNLYLCLEHGGIVRSLDRGETWEDVSKGIDYLDIHMLLGDPVRKGRYYVTSARGFFRSEDPGVGWTRIQGGIDRDYFHDLLFPSGDPPAMLIASANGSPGRWNRPGMAQAAIFRSLDGDTWHQVGEGLPSSLDQMVWSLVSPSSGIGELYAGCGQVNRGQPGSKNFPAGPGSVWFSPDRGSSWCDLGLEIPAVRTLWTTYA